jgi:hypothetical protein
MTIEDITFAPNNEGEPATYSFTIISPGTIDAGTDLLVWFPEQFDPSINTNPEAVIECWTDNVEYLGTQINC